jgi:hypothetical protein
MKTQLTAWLIAAASTLVAVPADAIEFKVYPYMTPKKGETEAAYWFTNIVKSDKPYDYFGKTLDREGLQRHSLEIEHGVTDHWTIAGYADFENPVGGDFKYVRARALVTRYRFFEKGERFVDPALYVEYYLPYHKYSDNEKIEARVILEKDVGPVAVILNPIFEKNISGEVEEGVELEYAAGIYLSDLLPWLTPGVEFYGEVGELGDMEPADEQEHFVFPAVKVRLPEEMAVDLGYGFGLTRGSDDQVLKVILEMEMD